MTKEYMEGNKKCKAKQAIQQVRKHSAYFESINDEIEDCFSDDSTTETVNAGEETATEDETEIEISLSKNHETRR